MIISFRMLHLKRKYILKCHEILSFAHAYVDVDDAYLNLH